MRRRDDEELDGASDDAGQFQCPYCWELVEPPIDADLEGELVWDCEVCCRPWLIHVSVDYDGRQSVSVERAQN